MSDSKCKTTTHPGWSLDTLYTHLHQMIVDLSKRLDARIEADAKLAKERSDAQDKSVREALAAADKATSKSAEALKERAEASNEIRGAMKDMVELMTKSMDSQAKLMMPRIEAEKEIESLEEKLGDLSPRVGELEGQKRGSISMLSIVVMVIGTLVGISGFVLAWSSK